MSSLWIASMVLQWLVVALLCVVVTALIRQMGTLTLRLNSLGKDADGDGPGLYTSVKRHQVSLLTGGTFPLGGDQEKASMVVFYSPGCGPCAGMDAEISKFVDGYPMDELSLLVVLMVSKHDAENYLAHESLTGVPVAVRENFPEQYLPMGRMPYAYAMNMFGKVAARGRPRDVKAFKEMAHAARFMADTAADDIVRPHEWGETAPYWMLRDEPEAGAQAQEIADQRAQPHEKEANRV